MSSTTSTSAEKDGSNYQAQIMDTLQLRGKFIQRNQLQTSEDVDHLLSLSEKIYNSIIDDKHLKTLFTNERFYDHAFFVFSKLPHVVRTNDVDDVHQEKGALKLFETLLCILRSLVSKKRAMSDEIEKAKKLLSKMSYIDLLFKFLKDFHYGTESLLHLRSRKSMTELFKIFCASTTSPNPYVNIPVKQLASTKEPVIFIQELIVDYCLEEDERYFKISSVTKNLLTSAEHEEEEEGCVRWGCTLLTNLCTAIGRGSQGIQDGIVNRLPEFRDQFLLPILAKSSCGETILWTLNVLGNLRFVGPVGISDATLADVLCFDEDSNFVESLLSNVLEARKFETLTKSDSAERKELSRICMHFFVFFINCVDERQVFNRRLTAQKFKYLKIFADFFEHIRQYRDLHYSYLRIIQLLINDPGPQGRSHDELLSASFITSRTRAFLASDSEFGEKFAKKQHQDHPMFFPTNAREHSVAMKVLKLTSSTSKEEEKDEAKEDEEEGSMERETEIVDSLFG